MELVWHGRFDQYFGHYDHEWQLVPTKEAPPAEEPWHFFKDSAKVRFQCDVSINYHYALNI